MSRGDVWWYEPPDAKRRPALIMTRMEAAQSLNELFVILATTTVRGLPTEVELGPEDGMPRSCVLNDDHASAADKAFLTERITRLGSERMSENLSCARLRDELLSATPAPQNRVPKYVPK